MVVSFSKVFFYPPKWNAKNEAEADTTASQALGLHTMANDV